MVPCLLIGCHILCLECVFHIVFIFTELTLVDQIKISFSKNVMLLGKRMLKHYVATCITEKVTIRRTPPPLNTFSESRRNHIWLCSANWVALGVVSSSHVLNFSNTPCPSHTNTSTSTKPASSTWFWSILSARCRQKKGYVFVCQVSSVTVAITTTGCVIMEEAVIDHFDQYRNELFISVDE